jgi:flagellar basal body-associated protein FliL
MAKVMLVCFVVLSMGLVVACFFFFYKYRQQIQILRNPNTVAPQNSKQQQMELVQQLRQLVPTVYFGEKGVD